MTVMLSCLVVPLLNHLPPHGQGPSWTQRVVWRRPGLCLARWRDQGESNVNTYCEAANQVWRSSIVQKYFRIFPGDASFLLRMLQIFSDCLSGLSVFSWNCFKCLLLTCHLDHFGMFAYVGMHLQVLCAIFAGRKKKQHASFHRELAACITLFYAIYSTLFHFQRINLQHLCTTHAIIYTNMAFQQTYAAKHVGQIRHFHHVWGRLEIGQSLLRWPTPGAKTMPSSDAI